MYHLKTTRGYDFAEVSSAMQKAIRRSDAKLAGYWAIELWESGYAEYVWRRLFVISAEDCWGVITHELTALKAAYDALTKAKKRARIFVAKAVILLAMARKSRDADHLTNLVYDAIGISEEEIEKSLNETRTHTKLIPPYALDCHTKSGKSAGKTKAQFFRDEFEALKPREPGLFDMPLQEGKVK